MEEQVPPSNFFPSQQSTAGQITPEQLEQMKARAKELAIMQTYQQNQARAATQPNPLAQPTPQIVYVKRALTVAEIIVMFAVACGVVFGTQLIGSFVINNMPQIEIKMK